MTERRVTACLILAMILLISGSLHARPPTDPPSDEERPNILFVLTDDMRWDDAEAFGNPTVRTPSIDELTREGKTFNRTFVSSPVCHPSRSSFLSGLYVHQEGIQQAFIGARLEEGIPTVATELNDLGYQTGFVGKAHPTGTPHDWGFQHVPAYDLARLGRNPRENGRLFFKEDGETTIVHRDTTRYLVDRGIEFMRDHRDDRWFLWFATNAPHTPYFFSEDHPYSNSELERPPGYPDSDPFPNVIPAFEEKTGVEITDPSVRASLMTFWRDYYSLTSTMDEQLGRLFRALEETGQAENTVVVFTSDHGIQHGSHGFLFKNIWYEESTRVSTIVRWPGEVEPGTETDSLISNVDFLHTFVDLAGGNTRDLNLEGRSFVPLMLDQRRRTRGFVFSEGSRLDRHGGGNWNMLRGDRFKYVTFEDTNEQYLYDLKNDFHEQRNLIHQVPSGIQQSLKRMVRRFEASDTEGKALGPDGTGESRIPAGVRGQCLIGRAVHDRSANQLRRLRDGLLASRVGRLLTRRYYRLSERVVFRGR